VDQLTTVEIKEPEKPEEFEAIEAIQIDAWRMNDRDVVPSRIAIAIHEAGGCVYLAYIDKNPVGFVLGFLARRKDRIYLHSHQVGVKRAFWRRGIGYKLKLKQREWALKRDIELIRWTFDPLLSRNAYFNFYKLGVINDTYKINLYGEMKDEINKGMESDRFYVEWWLKSRRVSERISGIRPPYNIGVENLTTVIDIEEKNGIPKPSQVDLDKKEKMITVPIPSDIEAIKRINLKIAIEWRLATRKVFTQYLSKGYVVVEFIARREKPVSYYVLTKENKGKILEYRWWEEFEST